MLVVTSVRSAHDVRLPLAATVLVLLTTAGNLCASLTLTTGVGATHAGNLVVNGSFETGAPADGVPTYWATGTSNTPFSLPAGWSSAGVPFSYASWGNDGAIPYRLRASDNLPDGRAGMYFGAGTGASVGAGTTPVFNNNGSVTFSGNPMVPIPASVGPVQLWQSVPTNFPGATSFKMSFWVSGEENSTVQGFPFPGILGLRVTNVLPGDPIQWLAVPNNVPSNPFGAAYGSSILYEYLFTPLNPLLPVEIRFINLGHFTFIPSQPGLQSTEVIIDDVIVNAVGIPEPAAGAAAGTACVAIVAGRRRRRR